MTIYSGFSHEKMVIFHSFFVCLPEGNNGESWKLRKKPLQSCTWMGYFARTWCWPWKIHARTHRDIAESMVTYVWTPLPSFTPCPTISSMLYDVIFISYNMIQTEAVTSGHPTLCVCYNNALSLQEKSHMVPSLPHLDPESPRNSPDAGRLSRFVFLSLVGSSYQLCWGNCME